VGFLIALSILTTFPLRFMAKAPGYRLTAAIPWFPLVGGTIGLVMGLLDRVMLACWPLPVVCALDLAILLALTGGLHLDGLMDTVDGLAGGRERVRALDAMRDPRVGGLGAAAGFASLLLRYAALLSLPAPGRLTALVLISLLGRWAILPGITFWSYARAEPGLGRPFARGLGKPGFVLLTLAVGTAAYLLASYRGLWAFGLAAGSALALAARVGRRLGGLTGDVYGAMSETGELAASLALVFWLEG